MQKTDTFIPYIRIVYHVKFSQISIQYKYVGTIIWKLQVIIRRVMTYNNIEVLWKSINID